MWISGFVMMARASRCCAVAGERSEQSCRLPCHLPQTRINKLATNSKALL